MITNSDLHAITPALLNIVDAETLAIEQRIRRTREIMAGAALTEAEAEMLAIFNEPDSE